MTVLITGATGLVGQALVRNLLDNPIYANNPQKIRLLVRKKNGSLFRQHFLNWCNKKGIDIFLGDLANTIDVFAFTKVEDPDDSVLIHCGAIFNFWQPYEYLYDINVSGTNRILNAFDQNMIKKMVYLSSVAVYGNLSSNNGQEVTEEFPIDLKQKKSYILSKALGENMVRIYQEKHPNRLITIIRPTGIIGGPGCTLDSFARMIIRQIAFLPRGGNDKISLVDSKDVARAIEFVMNFERGNGEVFNLVSFTPTLREVILELGKTLRNKEIKVISVPLFVFKPMYYLARVIRKLKKPQEKSLLIPILFDKLGQDIWIDNSKIQSLGFKPVVTLSESMKNFEDFLSRNPWYSKEKFGIAL